MGSAVGLKVGSELGAGDGPAEGTDVGASIFAQNELNVGAIAIEVHYQHTAQSNNSME